MARAERQIISNPRTTLGKTRMPRWQWQLKRKGFHVQLKKYMKFLWQQRPGGCNWSRELRGRYFDRTYHTIAKWDKFLLDLHLVWISGESTLNHRIGARPYYFKDLWIQKSREAKLGVRCVTNYTPYTAQQSNSKENYYSTAGRGKLAERSEPRFFPLPASVSPDLSQGAPPPETPDQRGSAPLDSPCCSDSSGTNPPDGETKSLRPIPIIAIKLKAESLPMWRQDRAKALRLAKIILEGRQNPSNDQDKSP